MTVAKKKVEVKKMSQDELGQGIKDLREALAKARFQRGSGQLADRALVWRLRKSLARMLTASTRKSI